MPSLDAQGNVSKTNSSQVSNMMEEVSHAVAVIMVGQIAWIIEITRQDRAISNMCDQLLQLSTVVNQRHSHIGVTCKRIRMH